MTAILHLCSTCRTTQNHDALRACLPDETELRLHPCLNVCSKPTALSLQGNGASYLFGGIDPAADAADIAATVRAYMAAPDGVIVDARPCGRLRHCLIGRIPAP
ncbi:DUF1636 family protein [Palleronia abyssalis]|uniref:Metal-binding protein n=1 Tax=Palleronia abyssalis TaxID=1501240 RepID=A0A2R8BS88_9RHOB|nr:DUF1636 family protein [Palleronia abyssalis]SPJ23008.1 hypothetical protein PAA8504_00811 [Palleronia abyssalis]